MRIVCLQHASFEGPGNIAAWAALRGHSLRVIHLHDDPALPRMDEFDLLLVMGGPMSVHDEVEYGWLVPEKQLIAECLAQGKFVLGVCLGSQLLAECLGSPVYRNSVKEIGWFPIRLRSEADSSCLAGVPQQMHVLHWHGETYDLPPGCVHLAEKGCRVQAFEHPTALGVQFHMETTSEGVQAFLRNCGGEIGTGPYEQPPQELDAAEELHGDVNRRVLFEVLDRIARRVAANH